MSIHTRVRAAAAAVLALPALAGAQEAADGIWISREEIATLPMSGAAWEKLVDRASVPVCTPVLNDLDDKCNITVLAKALMYARTGETAYYDEIKASLIDIINSGQYSGRALPLARRLGAYVIAADIVDFPNRSPVLHNHLTNKLLYLRNAPTIDGPTSLVDCHESRLNNWGTSAGFTRLCIDLYVNDEVDLARTVEVWKGWMGDRETYAGFDPGSELSWQADPENPRGINAAGSTIDGHDVDGVLPDEQREGGPFAPPPYACLGSVRGALQGALCAGIIMDRQGLGASEWQDRALERAGTWFTRVAGCPLEGDDAFEAHLFNYLYPELDLPIAGGVQAGKLIAFADWTHGPWAATAAEVRNPAAGPSLLVNVSPNPSGEAVTARLHLAGPSDVLVRIVDVRGRSVETLHDGRLSAGSHRLAWDGRDHRGNPVAPGAYFVTTESGGRTEAHRIVRVR